MPWNCFFFLFRWQWYRYLHAINTSHYKLLLGTYDRRIVTVNAVLSRHSGSVNFGLDHIIILGTTKQLFSSSLLYEPIFTIDSVSCTGYMNALGHDSPRLSYSYIHTYMSYQWWAIWANNKCTGSSTKTCMFARCELYSIGDIIMFSGGELWATDEPSRDLSDVCVQNYDTGIDQWVALPSIWHWLG